MKRKNQRNMLQKERNRSLLPDQNPGPDLIQNTKRESKSIKHTRDPSPEIKKRKRSMIIKERRKREEKDLEVAQVKAEVEAQVRIETSQRRRHILKRKKASIKNMIRKKIKRNQRRIDIVIKAKKEKEKKVKK